MCVCWASLTPCPLAFRSMPTQQQTTIVKLLLIGDSGELSRPAVCFQSATPVVACMVVLLSAHRIRNATHLRARVRRAPPASASSLLLTPRPSVLSLRSDGSRRQELLAAPIRGRPVLDVVHHHDRVGLGAPAVPAVSRASWRLRDRGAAAPAARVVA